MAFFFSLIRDARDASRSLLRSPGYSIVIVLIFALGIGANTAVFTLADALLLKALPYANADRLVLAAEWPRAGGNWTVAPTMFAHWKPEVRSFAGIEARVGRNFALEAGGLVDEVTGARVTAGYFDLLGVAVARGRTFEAADASASAPCVAVVTDRIWHRRLGGDPAAVGRPIRLSGETCTLVGVLPPDSVVDRSAPEIYVPMVLTPAEARSEGRQLTVIGRLRDGVTVAQASAELAGLAATYNATRGSAGVNWTATAFPWRDILVRTDARQLVWLLFGAVAAVLLIACANVAGLALSRGIVRQREIAVRAALGAGRARLVRALVTENLVLAAVGGVAALVVGSLALRGLIALVPPGLLPAEIAPSLDGRALAFTLAAAAITGLLSGLLPGWQAGRVTLTEAMASASRGVTSSRRTSWMQSSLLVGELALAMVLVGGSALVAASLIKLNEVRPGFDPSRVLTLRLAPSSNTASDEAVANLYARARAAIVAVPGVEAAGAVTSLPLGGWLYGSPFVVIGAPAPTRPPSAHLQSVTPGYFEALKIGLASGRAFTDRDDGRAAHVAIVNQTLAQRFLPPGPVEGRVITLSPTPDPAEVAWTIVGMIRNVKTGGLGEADLATPEIYVPNAQAPVPTLFFAIRSAGADAARLVPDVRAAIRGVDPEAPVGSVMTMEARVGASLGAQRFRTSVLGAFAAIAALLACLGAYAVRSRAVAARLREMGIRTALGATRGQIVRLTLGQGARIAALGIGLGLLASQALTGYLRPWLFSTQPDDPLVIAAAVIILGGAALVASWIPARRAARVDPISVLRDS